MKSEEGFEREVLNEMEPYVRKQLKFLVGDRKNWWASQFFDFMESAKASDCEREERLNLLRKEACELKDSELVVLVGNEVTEEALPNYSSRLARLLPDLDGVSDNAWALWSRGWVAEEKMHGRVLDRYLMLSGRVNMQAVDSSVDSLIANGMVDQPDLFRSMLYPAFQEPATALSHMNMARLAKRKGVQTLHNICSKIANDENRHAAFYGAVAQKMMEIAPEQTLLAYESLMRDKVIMPAANMADTTYSEPPTLFEHFAGVASKIQVYTTRDYAAIVNRLNDSFRVAKASVSDAAARAQEYLCSLPEKLERIAERTKLRVAKPVGFDWIYGREA